MKPTIMELAQKVAAAEAAVDALAHANQPTDVKDRVAADARYRLTSDALYAARGAYNNAINGLSSDELLKLAQS